MIASINNINNDTQLQEQMYDKYTFIQTKTLDEAQILEKSMGLFFQFPQFNYLNVNSNNEVSLLINFQ